MTMMITITIVVVEITVDFISPFNLQETRFGDLQEGTQSSVQSSGDEEDVTA